MELSFLKRSEKSILLLVSALITYVHI